MKWENFGQKPDRIVLDLQKLLAEGKLKEDEATRLKSLAERPPVNRTIANVMSIFGALMVVAGVLALEPPMDVGLGLAIAALGLGGVLVFRAREEWGLLGQTLVLMGTLGISGWMALKFDELGGIWPYVTAPAIALVTILATLVFRNAVTAALSPIAIANLIGSGTQYWHAAYGLYVREAALSILIFGTMATVLYFMQNRIPPRQHSNAIIAARVSFILANFGFWVGSLWGDYPGELWQRIDFENWETMEAWRASAFFIPDFAFSIGWVIALAVAFIVGLQGRNRFIANTSLVFLGIHFYTQLFETFLASPWGLVIGGIGLTLCGFALFRFDRWLQTRRDEQPVQTTA